MVKDILQKLGIELKEEFLNCIYLKSKFFKDFVAKE